MDAQVWWAFFAASWLISLSPGSAAILSLSQGLSYGVRHTSVTVVGMGLGVGLILLIAGAGVGSLLLTSSAAFTLVKILGSAYLIWLGWKQWHASLPLEQIPETLSFEPPDLPTAKTRFTTGFLTNATNPKGIVFMVAVLPQFIDPSRPLCIQLLALLVTSVLVEMAVMHGYAFMAARSQRWLSSAKAQQRQNRVFGSVLMIMGASLLLVGRRA